MPSADITTVTVLLQATCSLGVLPERVYVLHTQSKRSKAIYNNEFVRD